MKPPKDALMLIDGHAVLYRAFHALPPLKTKDGIPTNAVYGFVTTLLKAFEDINPRYCAVAFDVAKPTFRHEAFAGYKANRKETPQDLVAQVPYAYQVVESLNMPLFTKEGFEADDVIGTLAKQAREQGIPVVIVTGDRDAFQLVDEGTFVYTMRRSIADTMLFDNQAVQGRMGVRPDQIIHFKALAGDASDEIPGVPGIGEKTAVSLLQQINDIDELYHALHDNKPLVGVTERIREKLLSGEASARQSLELATIHRDVPITLELRACHLTDYDPDKVAKVFGELEFYSLLKRLPKPSSPHEAQANTSPRDWTYRTLRTRAEIAEAVKRLMPSDFLAVDTETEDLHGPIVGVSLAASGEEGYYIPTLPEHGAELTLKEIGDLLRPLLESSNVGKVGHNIKYDMHTLEQLDIDLKPIAFDSMIAAYVLHAHLRSFDFDSVCQRELGYTPIPLTDIAKKAKGHTSLIEADPDKLAEYAAEDAILTYRLFEHLGHKLESEDKLKDVAQRFDIPLIPVLKRMEDRGICVDKSRLEDLSKELEKAINQVTREIEQYAPEPININSPAQLQKLLFETLGIDKKGIKATQNGVSTAASELEKIQGTHPIIDAIMRYRELTKLQSTYVKTLPDLIAPDGRIHTQFSQTTAATGRLSSTDPNLQNIPIRTELGNKIRAAFTAPEGYKLVSLDYSQFELRIIAHLSGDEQLIRVFRDGRDIHDEVAKKLHIDRRAAKAINFGIIYGLSAFGLSQGLKIDPKIARDYIDAYFATYPQLKQYLDRTKEEIREKGYVTTLFGRRREIPEIHAANAVVRAQAERMAINAPAQGTEADLMKLAMVEVDRWLETEYGSTTERPHLILQVHDSLLLEVPQHDVHKVAQRVTRIMEEIDSLDVPLEVDCAVGENWGELEYIKAA